MGGRRNVTFAHSALLLILVASACGGGGSGDSASADGSLSFRAVWEQPNNSKLLRTGLPVEPAASFGPAIPAAVNAVRITLAPTGPDDPPACCVAVPRGSAAFVARRLVLGSLPAGDVLVAVDGFPTAFAPADGFASRCVTVPANDGVACEGAQRALPSFLATPNAVTIIPGERTSAGDIAIASVPFPVDLSPAEGAIVAQAQVPVRFAVVTANNAIAPGSIDVRVQAGSPPRPFGVTIATPQPCDERVPNPTTRCTTGADLDVAGFLVDALTDPLPAGPATLTIEAEDNANPPRQLLLSYGITVNPGATTTTSTSTTSTTSTSASTSSSTSLPVQTTLPPTTTTITIPPTTSTLPPTTTTTQVTTTTLTTTTTLQPPIVCSLTFGVNSSESLATLAYNADYTTASGRFERLSEGARCSQVRPEAPVFTFDDETKRILSTTINSPVTGFANPGDVALCKFYTADPTLVTINDFVITVTSATLVGGGAANPAVALNKLTCGPSGTTTTTTLPPLPQSCDITFGFTTSDLISQLNFAVNYLPTEGAFDGTGNAVQCVGLAGDNHNFFDDETNRRLDTVIFSANGMPGPTDVALCRYTGPAPPGFEQGFLVNTLLANDPNGNPTGAAVVVTNAVCGVP